jgi:hypothetical protein
MPGALSKPEGSEPITSGDGGVAIRKDGIAIGTPRDTLNLITTPGVVPRVVDDATPGLEKSDIGWDIQADVELARVTGVDLVAGVGTLNLIPALGGTEKWIVTRIHVIAETVDPSPAVQPIIAIETPAGAGDHFAATSLVLAGATFQELLPLVEPRPFLDSSAPNNLLDLVQSGLATSAGGYTVTVSVRGFVLTP